APGPSWRRSPIEKHDATMHAAGGHFTAAQDLARFVAAHASGELVEGRRVFPAAVIASTHEKHADQDREFGPYHRFGWGYGRDLGTWQGRTIIHRFGGFTGFRSHASFEPASQVGVVVLVNGEGPASAAVDLLATYVYDRLLGRPDFAAFYDSLLADFQRRLSDGEKEVARTLAQRAARLQPLPHPLAGYAGTYENPKYGRMTWRVVADGLGVRMGVAVSRAEVYDAAKDELRVELLGGGSVAGFEFPAAGGPATAVMLGGQRYERTE
ncbi:MAG: serine hydrolase, partial [Gammaproteobacteria bacterium]